MNNIVIKHIHVSLDEELVKRIDNDRGDVSRSRFLLRIIERYYSKVKKA